MSGDCQSGQEVGGWMIKWHQERLGTHLVLKLKPKAQNFHECYLISPGLKSFEVCPDLKSIPQKNPKAPHS